MSKNFGYFGNGIDGYIHYKQSFDDNFGDDGNDDFDDVDEFDEDDYDDFEDLDDDFENQKCEQINVDLTAKIKAIREIHKLACIINERSCGRKDTVNLIDEFWRICDEFAAKFPNENISRNLIGMFSEKRQDILEILNDIKDDELKYYEIIYLKSEYIQTQYDRIKELCDYLHNAKFDLPDEDMDESKLKEYTDIFDGISNSVNNIALGLLRKFVDTRQIANLQAYAETLRNIELPYNENGYDDIWILADEIDIAISKINELLELSRKNVMSGKTADEYFIDNDDDDDDDFDDDDDDDFEGLDDEY